MTNALRYTVIDNKKLETNIKGCGYIYITADYLLMQFVYLLPKAGLKVCVCIGFHTNRKVQYAARFFNNFPRGSNPLPLGNFSR